MTTTCVHLPEHNTGTLWISEVVPVSIQTICKHMNDIEEELLVLNSLAWNCANKWASACFKMFPTNYPFTNHISRIYTYKQDLALNNQQGLICHKIQPTNHYFDIHYWLTISLKRVARKVPRIYFSQFHYLHKSCPLSFLI